MQTDAKRAQGCLRGWFSMVVLALSLAFAPGSVALAQDCTVQSLLASNGCTALSLTQSVVTLGDSLDDGVLTDPDGESGRAARLPFSTSITIIKMAGGTGLPLAVFSSLSTRSRSTEAAPTILISGLGVGMVATSTTPEALNVPDLGTTLGTIGEIGVRMDLVKSIIELLLKHELPRSGKSDAVTVNLLVNSWELFPYLSVQGQSTLSLDEQLKPFLSNVTIRLNTEFLNSEIGSETKLDPKDLQVLTEKLEIKLGLGGSTSLSGETIFERGQGLTSQIFAIESEVGNVKLTGQAIFTQTSQEFRIGASICDLTFTGTSRITPTGQIQPSFGITLKFGGPSLSSRTETFPCR